MDASLKIKRTRLVLLFAKRISAHCAEGVHYLTAYQKPSYTSIGVEWLAPRERRFHGTRKDPCPVRQSRSPTERTIPYSAATNSGYIPPADHSFRIIGWISLPEALPDDAGCTFRDCTSQCRSSSEATSLPTLLDRKPLLWYLGYSPRWPR